MYKEIQMLTTEGVKAVPMLANGATAIRYRQVFHRDLMRDMIRYAHMNDDPDHVDWDMPGKLGFILASHAAGKDMGKLTEEDYIDWVEQFEGDTLWTCGQQIVEIYSANQTQTSTAKK